MSNEFFKHREPDEVFLPVNEERYADFYSIEMNNFQKDIVFYKKHCLAGSSVLELGCGTGRISRSLASHCSLIAGLDLSLEMLKRASTYSANRAYYVCMDMTQFAFKTNFDNILIPYNTLNLLKDETRIKRCLRQVQHILKRNGTLLLQLPIPDQKLMEMNGEKRFQFQIFPLLHCKGKLIKETLRSFNSDTQTIRLEERYRVRPTDDSASKKDFCHTLHLAGFSVKRWLEILNLCGYQNLTLFGDYNSRPFQIKDDSILLIKASRC
jgi:ubiquinone/menaquinone biosynthesis C-methylase UbiE